MNFTNKHKLFFSVVLLFIFTFILTRSLIIGIATSKLDYLIVILSTIMVILGIYGTIKFNKNDNNNQA